MLQRHNPMLALRRSIMQLDYTVLRNAFTVTVSPGGVVNHKQPLIFCNLEAPFSGYQATLPLVGNEDGSTVYHLALADNGVLQGVRLLCIGIELVSQSLVQRSFGPQKVHVTIFRHP